MTAKPSGVPIEILMVEDNPADIRLAVEGFRDAKIANNLHVVQGGDKALEFLRRQGPFIDEPRPDIVLLDLNLPGKDGREVLREIKHDPDLQVIPVVILTSSEDEGDVLASYKCHANALISKPVDFEGLREIIETLEEFWFAIVRLPPAPESGSANEPIWGR